MHDHWPLHARQWALVGPPLRPDRDDVAWVTAEVAAWRAAHRRPPRALLLGVTPELATLAWPDGTALIAVDRAAAMIAAIFPRTGMPARSTAVRGEWTALPIAAGAIDLAIGDGCLSNLAFPGGYRDLAAELGRVLGPGGRLILRVFAAPERSPSLDEVGAALAGGAIGSFHALKWRVAMAIQPADRNVAVADIRHAVDALVPDRDALAARTGWPREVIDTIDAYRDSGLSYSFPTAREVAEALGPALAVIADHPGDERGERYPTTVWTAR